MLKIKSYTPSKKREGHSPTATLFHKWQQELDYICSENTKNSIVPTNKWKTVRTLTAVQYIQNVKDLLDVASQEYKAGNATGAQALVETAYLDNFEYVEPELEQRNATDLKEELETMLRIELIGLMRDGADQQTIDDKITLINLKLDEAIAIVPEFPIGISLLIVAFTLTSAIILVRFKRKDVGAASGHLPIWLPALE